MLLALWAWLGNEPISSRDTGPYRIDVDGTLGGGGHSRGICERLGEDGLLIGIDRDTDALKAAQKNLEEFKCRKIFVHDNYSNIKRVLEGYQIERIDGAVLDLGVSSSQLDAE